MTETTTKVANEHAAQIWPDPLAQAAGEIAVSAPLGTELAIHTGQARFSEAQRAALRQLGIEDATDGDLDVFFHVCQTTGLDPFRKEIYMIGRNTKLTEWLDNGEGGRRKVERYVTKYTIQTGIDGFRRKVREYAHHNGDTLAVEGPFYCGDDGEWKEVWPGKTPPVAAKFTVIRNGEPFTAVAHFDEFVQTNNVYEGTGQGRKIVGQEPNSMWAKMPRNQIGKCAEAAACRRAYPNEFAGLILTDAAQPTVIDGEVVEERQAPPQRAKGASRLRERAAEAAAQQSAQAAETAGELSADAREKWLKAMFAALNKAECTDRDEQLIVIAGILGRTELFEHRADMTDQELRTIVNALNGFKEAGRLDQQINEYVNAWSLREADELDAVANTDTDGGEQGELGLESDQN
ncbi:RecT-family phage protein [Mycobacteroides abscessus subsp. abscessus]|uniref:recombinase RecT n=1 Tax=Mycobacteroides abscessus TaxID=36809 RepID=UPI00034D58E0|nr:recombinase RecT [Mycobacteroides abscessus]MDO3045204.1 recombinase RecT [Mycobacteroides abscessus subsp. abscessus]MDO3137105.1 recombinase RecT [Mycobacteroides abscessus subsp. abscessus]MDO3151670.1 recombinase RecT [Mycobacteroides abscessus subsp. abscessus]MDO3245230.1 recombinase RecT [Mycobacteroides abscessus subsp. abscessus]MDO3347263.1 recombinase RecT [Mycobacteroides abscessus subsp. abscessus]